MVCGIFVVTDKNSNKIFLLDNFRPRDGERSLYKNSVFKVYFDAKNYVTSTFFLCEILSDIKKKIAYIIVIILYKNL